ncbi:hypothetical protein LR48_Vigan04g251300 [Vigna angularis]|uniref:RING-type domain-containing protein n=2 Tax=Phaseolus angularis TaxID=3914 RepID=A0A0L9UHC5_PHAAN|nr:uncharacterized protein LOC108332115 isoform X1 [Vigna angularis]XP_017422726.1 uncharacterized protein LOC108332115 isoform X1 [Vigna angularis]KOM42315.1 hypothetical protein LR48_Vigan04g251300 [Vigna angularis]BAT77509.1 hypothetical protein VIGAN_02009200 [Vigna angularis var. angularis]
MGAACCVASRDKTIQSGSTSDILHRNVRCSPTWSFRWDHRGRVAGEDISINWFSDGISRNDGSENKNESAYVSEDGSPLQNYQRKRFQQSPISEATAVRGRNSTSDQSFSGTVSTDMSVEQVNGLVESSTISCPSPTKPSLPSTSLSTSPLASQCHIPPSNLTPVRWPCHSPGYQLSQQASDSRIPAVKSSSSFSLSEERPVFPSWNNDVGMRSHGGSSDGWSIPGFSELMGTPHKERWSFDSESFGFNRERLVRSSSWFSASSVDLQSCGICSKLLAEKSSWSTQKIIASNDLSVVSVLICGHVYHAECLERMTSDINKYDPACPVCTFGEKQTMKLSAKALKAEMDLKARNNKSKNRIVDSDIDDDSVVFDGFKGKCPRNDSSSSRRSSFGKPFLRRHFSFGSKGPRSMLDNHPTRKKGFFWAKSSKE